MFWIEMHLSKCCCVATSLWIIPSLWHLVCNLMCICLYTYVGFPYYTEWTSWLGTFIHLYILSSRLYWYLPLFLNWSECFVLLDHDSFPFSVPGFRLSYFTIDSERRPVPQAWTIWLLQEQVHDPKVDLASENQSLRRLLDSWMRKKKFFSFKKNVRWCK